MYFLVKSGTGYLMKIDDNPHLASNDEDPKVMHFYNVDDAVHAVLQLHFRLFRCYSSCIRRGLGMIFFTADGHLGHKNIIKYCNRPFSSIEEMDEEIISRWNSKVKADDIVYYMGDFTLGDITQAKNYFRQLNGYVNMIAPLEHHDKRWLSKALLDSSSIYTKTYEVTLFEPIITLKFNDIVLALCHFPFAEWDRKHHGSWHLHGHSHNRLERIPKRVDIGVDGHDFYPWSLDEIVALEE